MTEEEMQKIVDMIVEELFKRMDAEARAMNEEFIHELPSDEEQIKELGLLLKYYEKIEESMNEQGYATVNELILDLLRHHFDSATPPPPKRKLGVPTPTIYKKTKRDIPKVIKTKEDAERQVKHAGLCKHMMMKGLCKYGC